MVRVDKAQYQGEQTFAEDGDFTIYLMRPQAHQIMQHKMTEEH